MPELPIRPEALEKAEKAFTYEPADPDTKLFFSAGMRAAIVAFCEAEGLTVERDEHKQTGRKSERLVGPWHGKGGAMSGAELIQAERIDQVRKGWTPEHDAQHNQNELAHAAISYLMPNDGRALVWWPWEMRDYKPRPYDRVRELVKAGGLIAAEIDRLQRKAQDD